MYKIKWIRDNAEYFNSCMAHRNCKVTAEQILDISKRVVDEENRYNDLKAASNEISRRLKSDRTPELIEEAKRIKAEYQNFVPTITRDALDDVLSLVPNILDPSVPIGADETGNVFVRDWGSPRSITPEHDIIIDAYMDKQAALISGNRFSVLRGSIARLERALGQFMIDIHTTTHGFEEISTPVIVNEKTMFGTGQLPNLKDDVYSVGDGKYLIPTSEVTLTNLYRDVLHVHAEPIRMTALTPCFRKEAGNSGKDVKGLIRQHQFNKVEMVSIVEARHSDSEHQYILGCAETILKQLELPYRVMLLCGGDTGFSSTKTYDLEVWMPGQQTYREISSVSNCGSFQAIRLNARYYDEDRVIQYYHTLNGSGLAVGRTLVALIENHYDAETNSIDIPDKLRPYLGMVDKINLGD